MKYLFDRKKDILALLLQAQQGMGSEPFWVEDKGGSLLFGQARPAPANRHPVQLDGESIGWVSGGPKAEFIANMLAAFAGQESEKKKLGAEVLHLYQEINLIYNFSEHIAASIGTEAIAQMAMQEARRLIDFDGGWVVFWGESQAKPQLLARLGTLPFPPETLLHDQNPGLKALEAGQSGIFHWPGTSNEDETCMLLHAPLRVNDRLLGGIALARQPQPEYTAAETKLLTTLALQAAAAIESSLQYEKAINKALELQGEKLKIESLKQLDELKSRFFTNITHEFRTPLTVILGMAELPESENQRELLERFELIRKSGRDMLRLINQLLDLAKLENNALSLNYIHGDCVLFLKQMLEPFQLFATEKKLTLEIQAPNKPLMMDFDPDHLQQVVSNLLSNAIKFTAAGGRIQVLIDSTTIAAEPTLQLTISDTGIGIPAADMPHIFDRFYQSKSTQSIAVTGSGIGLSYAQEIIRLMGGTISAESQPEAGSCFIVRLPVRHDHAALGQAAPVPVHQPEPLPENPAVASAHKPLLLLIEDNPDLVRYLYHCLTPFYQVETAGDGDSGIEKALELIPDIIISDVMMPGPDGFEVCHRIKTDERTSHIPVVLLTARSDTPSRIEGLRRGADAYLAKPFDREELLIRLENLLALRKRLQARYAAAVEGESPDNQAPELDLEDAFIRKLRTILDENLPDEHFALPELCRALGMSRSQLFRKMKVLINIAPSHFIRSYRLHRAKHLLEHTDLQVAEIAYNVGYKDPAYFSNSFQEAFGVTPSSVREV